MARSLIERLEARTERRGTCLVWTGVVNGHGHGRIWQDGRFVFTHRAAYEALAGPIPEGLVLDHTCRVRACWNVLHLEPVTQRENVLRAPTALAALNAAKTHCPKGHPYDAANTAHRNGRRHCRTCDRERHRPKP